MDDIRKVPDALIRGRSETREVPGYGGSQWRERPLPFYMTYPLPTEMQMARGTAWGEEDAIMRDLDYLLQMYPRQAKRYREKIGRMLDAMDHAGSLIYDEYPDRLALLRLSEDIWREIRKEEEAGWEKTGGEDAGTGRTESEAYWERIRELIQILLYYEIYRRRRGTPPMMEYGRGFPRRCIPCQGNRRWDPQNGAWNPYGKGF